jgi:hypothetical protein
MTASLDIDVTETSTSTERRSVECTVELETLGNRVHIVVSDERRLPEAFRGPRLSLQLGNFGMRPADWVKVLEAVDSCLRLYANRWGLT